MYNIRFTIILIFIAVIGFNSFAQSIAPPIQWGKLYDLNLAYDAPKAVSIPSTDYFVISGYYATRIVDEEGSIIKVASNDNLNGASIKPVSSGGFILARSITASTATGIFTSFTGFGGTDAALIKLNDSLEIEWAQNYGGSGADAALDVQPTSDGGFIFVGTTVSIDGQLTGIKNFGTAVNYYVVKTDSLGNMQWTKTFGGFRRTPNPYGTFYGANRVIESAEGGYLIVGGNGSDTTGGSNITHPRGHTDLWVVKIDTAGNMEWQKSLGGSAEERTYGDVKQLADGNYVLTCLTRSADFDVSERLGGYLDGWIVKLDASDSGAVIWDRTIGGLELEDIAISAGGTGNNMAILPDGNLAVIFCTSPDALSTYPTEVGSIILAKIDSDSGNVIYEKYYGPTVPSGRSGLWAGARGLSIHPKNDGRILIFGSTNSIQSTDFDTAFTTYDTLGLNYSNLNVQLGWSLMLAPCPAFADVPDVTICKGSTYTFGSQSITSAGVYYDTLVSSISCDSIVKLIVMVDSVDKPIINNTEGVLTTDDGYATYQWLKDGSAVSTGGTSYTYTAYEPGAYQVVVTNANGCTDTSEVYNYTPSSINEPALFSNMKLYPNPASEVVNIEIPQLKGNATIELSSLDGRVIIDNVQFAMSNYQLSIADLPSGVYFIKITSEEGIAVRKIVKE